MGSILTYTRLLVNHWKHLVRGQQSAERVNSAIAHIGSVNEANPEKMWTTIWIFPWHILRHIFLPQDRKTIKRQQNPSADRPRRFFSATATQGKSAFNFRWFQEPIRSCDIVLTALAVAFLIFFPGNGVGRWWYFEQAKFIDTESVFPRLPKVFDIFIRKGQYTDKLIDWEICWT